MMKKIIYLAAAIALLASITACQEDLGITSQPQPEAEQVTVSLSLGFADEEDGFTVSASDTRANTAAHKGSFDAQLTPTVHTRTDASKPDALYELRILQYDLSGALKSSKSFSNDTKIGAELSVSLNAMDDCQLVILACGESNTALTKAIDNLSNGSKISELQNLTLKKAYFDAIPVDGSGMNKMPYILHLPHVKVTSAGIQSVEGAHDARLLLKRLAAKLTLVWNNNLNKDDGYVFKEVKLCQIPSVFRLLPAPTQTQWGMAYPSVVAEYIEYYRLTGAELTNSNTKTVWIPANVRGTSPASSTDNYRTKANAPDAASYAEIVVDNSAKNERLFYRAYLGGKDPKDYNLRENTDYAWTLNIKSTNYRGDARIQLLDQTPVKSTNEVPTSNCFMMQPGTNICFNPYKHEAGTGGWNTYLTDGSSLTSDKTISTVKVLWQNKDAGTSGDLVMGYAISDGNHTNLINYADLGDLEKARVYVKVPVTQGGNAVVAAYHGDVIVWSWHIWISDYVPATVVANNINDDVTRLAAIETAQKASIGGTVHAYLGTAWRFPDGAYRKNVIMDRNLGAIRNTYSLDNDLDAARAYGYLYQWGRKDPIPGSVDGTSNEVGVIYDGDGRGVVVKKVTASNNTLTQSIQNPISFLTYLVMGDDSWGGNSNKKTLYDPCPAGWRVPIFTNDLTTNLFQGMAMGVNTKMLIKGAFQDAGYDGSEANFDVKNGFYYNKEVWLPTFRLREASTGELRSPYDKEGNFRSSYLPSYGAWSAVAYTSNLGWYIESKASISAAPGDANKGYGFSIRCIQENR